MDKDVVSKLRNKGIPVNEVEAEKIQLIWQSIQELKNSMNLKSSTDGIVLVRKLGGKENE